MKKLSISTVLFCVCLWRVDCGASLTSTNGSFVINYSSPDMNYDLSCSWSSNSLELGGIPASDYVTNGEIPAITNAFYTNLISAEPVIANGTLFIETNGAGSGGGATNGIQQINGVATNTTLYSAINIWATNITAQSMILSNGQNYGTYQPSNVDILEDGWAVAQFTAGSGINGHIIIGSTNNSTGLDTGNKDSGVGIFGGNWNLITDYPSTHMIDEYIFGGYSNTVETFYHGTPQFGTYTNNDILASIFCTIDLDSGSGPTAWAANNNVILGSDNSGIITTAAGASIQDNLILNGSNSVANAVTPILNDVTIIGENANITNSHVVAISAGAAPFSSTTNGQILLEAPNGVLGNFTGTYNSTNGLGVSESFNIQTNSTGPHGWTMLITNGLVIGEAPY